MKKESQRKPHFPLDVKIARRIELVRAMRIYESDLDRAQAVGNGHGDGSEPHFIPILERRIREIKMQLHNPPILI